MAVILPTALFPGYTSDGNSITIPLAALGGLTAAEADAATGDGRKVAFELSKGIHERIQAMEPASRPVQFITSESTPTGQGPNEVRKSYTMTFDVNITSADVANEPA